MPHIVVTTSTYPRWSGDSHPGFVHDLCARLARDADVTVLAPTSHGAERDEVVDGVRVRRFAYWRDRPGLLRDGPALPTLRRNPLTALQVPTYLGALHRALRNELASRPVDVVHAHWVLPQGTLAALARGRTPPPRLVMTSHGSDVFGVPASGPALRWTLRRTDAFTGVSTAVVERARELGLPADTPAVVAPMGVDVDALALPDDAGERWRRQERIDGPLVLFVGRLTAVKGIDVLLDAAPTFLAANPDATLVVVGHGEREQELRRLAAANGVAERTRFVGFQPRSRLAHWYAAADVLVAPSRSEGFGLVMAEALVAGCPVVASALPAVRDILDASSAGRQSPVGDAPTLAATVVEALGDEELRARARADRTRQATRFGWDAAAARYRDVLLPTLG